MHLSPPLVSWLRCAGQAPNVDLSGAVARQYSGRGIGCRGCCHHVVDNGDVLASNRAIGGEGEGLLYIFLT